MADQSIGIQVDYKGAVEMLENVEKAIPDGSDDASEAIAEEGVKRLRRELYRQGMIVSAEGVNSLAVEKLGPGHHVVTGLRRLKYLETGTKPHFPPLDERIRTGARMYGISPYLLRRTIGRRGTKPHPFMKRALSPLINVAKKRGSVKIDENIGRST